MEVLDPTVPHEFVAPVKRINSEKDLRFFLSSKAYTDVMSFLVQLNDSLIPRKRLENSEEDVLTWDIGTLNVEFPPEVQKLGSLVKRLDSLIDDVPPDPGPRRFGNVSFRQWLGLVESKMDALLAEHLSPGILNYRSVSLQGPTVRNELSVYFNGSFGSAQRLDYGTGHELSFLAFLTCIWKLGGFSKAEPGVLERAIVLGIIEPYLRLMRRLITTYTLEPAGSHGVWGLDDHFFLPYILGSAQYAPPVGMLEQPAAEGSRSDAPDPGDIDKSTIVERERKTNMYFAGIGFIHDVKKGPFWEHSPTLYDISGVKAGWAKINKGMIKMYNGEVLSKFPVVQHFPFGSLLRWEHDINARPVVNSAHMHSQTIETVKSKPNPVSAPVTSSTPWTPSKHPAASASRSSEVLPSRPAPRSIIGQDRMSNMAGPNTGAMLPPTQAPWRESKPAR